ncbi:hypothetical protein BGZ94_010307 [Podila epigama]|nr:hypothetical protein BGZ94_010307 [Podila epigama]
MLQQPAQHNQQPPSSETTTHHDDNEDDFEDQLAGYNPGQKKTVNEYLSLDADDESLRIWKESLGVHAAQAIDANGGDGSNVDLLQLALEVQGRPDVVVDLAQLSEEDLKARSFTIKEGVEYRIKVRFRVRFGILAGLKYLQVVKRMGVVVDKTTEMVGSYAAQADPIEVRFAAEEAPSGMLARGRYEVRSRFVDDDQFVHREFRWAFEIKKDW